MRLAKQLLLISSFIYLVASCAQVGRLSGGDQDSASPRPVKTTPENEATNFKGNSFSITFDEYIRLNNPTESIVIVPPHVKPTATIQKKTLHISWDGELQPNTTYALYLNKAVKDITESNDSVMQFIFSTGSSIDTLSYKCLLHDAFSGKPLANRLIGAYSVSDTSLLNIAQSNENGEATMNYLSPGTYRFIAFNDANNDLVPQLNEAIGFKEETRNISESIVDSVPYRIFEPTEKPRVQKKKVISSSKIALSFSHTVDSASLTIRDAENNTELAFRKVSTDSVLVFAEDTTEWRSKKIVIEDDQFTDTLSLLNRSARTQVLFDLKRERVLPKEALVIELNQTVREVNDSLFKLLLSEDSTEVEIDRIDVMLDRIFIHPSQEKFGEMILDIEPGAIATATGINRKRTFNPDLLSEEDLTVLDADISAYRLPLIITCYNEGEEVRVVRTNGEEKITLQKLLPGNYTFQIVIDENNNGFWDTGNFQNRIQPEKVHFYSEPLRLRPNWESTVTFTRDE